MRGQNDRISSMSRARNKKTPVRSKDLPARERIFQAAVDLVCEGGPGAATARAICEKARITAPTLYHYYGDLYQLYDEVLQLMYVPEVLAHPGREFTDPRGMIEYMWDCCVGTAKKRPGIVELRSLLVSMERTPPSLLNFYARLELAFEQLALKSPLNFPPKTAAAMFWSAAIGTSQMIAATGHRGAPFPAGADDKLRESVLNAIIEDAPARKDARTSKAASAPSRRKR
jgi:AcrR family transcriptional regulator